MIGWVKKMIPSRQWSAGRFSLFVVVAYLVAMVGHMLYNIRHGLSMSNQVIAVWTSAGTVIAAVTASIYGSRYAFEWNRQKEIDARRQTNLEAGRWILVVLASHISYLGNIATGIYEEAKCEMWELRMKKILHLQELMPIKLEELRFLGVNGGERSNFLINFSMIHGAAFDLRMIVGLWNEKKDEAGNAVKPYIEAHTDEIPSDNPSDDEKKQFSQLLAREMGPKLTSELINLARTLLDQSEYGIRNLIKVYDGLEEHLKSEFPEAVFTGLNKSHLEKALGKKLWD